MQHAAATVAWFQLGPDGKTAYELSFGKKMIRSVALSWTKSVVDARAETLEQHQFGKSMARRGIPQNLWIRNRQGPSSWHRRKRVGMWKFSCGEWVTLGPLERRLHDEGDRTSSLHATEDCDATSAGTPTSSAGEECVHQERRWNPQVRSHSVCPDFSPIATGTGAQLHSTVCRSQIEQHS